MTLFGQLSAMCEAIPPGGSVTIPRDWLVNELARENGTSGCPPAEDRPLVIHPGPTAVSTSSESADRLVTARDVAARLKCSVRFVYAKAPSLPFMVRLGRMVRFSEAGLERWLAHGRRDLRRGQAIPAPAGE